MNKKKKQPPTKPLTREEIVAARKARKVQRKQDRLTARPKKDRCCVVCCLMGATRKTKSGNWRHEQCHQQPPKELQKENIMTTKNRPTHILTTATGEQYEVSNPQVDLEAIPPIVIVTYQGERISAKDRFGDGYALSKIGSPAGKMLAGALGGDA